MRIFLLASLMAGALGQASAPPAPSRLAVIGTSATADLDALVVAALSSEPGITLVERDDLAKIGDELKLQKLAGSDAIALGKLVGADGLLFLNKGPAGIQVRFTAVGLGYALFDDQIGAGTDLPQVAKSLAHRIAGYVPKLQLDPAKAIPLSVLNLRADYATPNAIALERNLTLLLESRLASLPEYVVLERRHAWSLGFERSLSTALPSLLQGAYVVDGTLSLSNQKQDPGEAIIRLRLRSPGNQQTPLEIRGPMDDLRSLVDSMTAEIRKATGNPAQLVIWNSQTEAREYFKEGLWGWQNDADAAALEALDSAELLGEKAPDLIPLRIGVLLRRAGRGLESSLRDPSFGMLQADQIIDDTLRAISDTARYEAEDMQPRLTLLTWQQHPDVRTDQIKENLANFVSKLLVYLESCQSSRADELRLALRAITGYDPLNGKLGRADYSDPRNVTTDLSDQWDITLSEQLAYFRLLCTKPYQYIPPGLLNGKGDGFCKRFLKTPAQQKEAFQRFLESLKDDPKGQLAYQLIMSCSSNATEADAAYTAYWQEMWKRREDLVCQAVQVQEWTSARPLPEERRRKHAREMIPLLRYYLTNVNNYRYWEYSLNIMWQPEQWSEAEAAAIWADFLGFKQRAAADRKARRQSPPNLSKFEGPFQANFPPIADPKSFATPKSPDRDSEPLVVNRLWHPWKLPGTPASQAMFRQTEAAGDALWLLAVFPSERPGGTALYKIRFSEFSAERIDLPEPLYAQGIAVGSKALYLSYYSLAQLPHRRRLGRFDLKTLTWDARDMDQEYRACFVVNDTLYFGLDGGIGRYDWETGGFTLLASSRRRPAQNQFDDCEPYQVSNVFAGPGGKTCVSTTRNGSYYIQEQPGEWPEVFDSTFWTRSVTQQGMTLVYAGGEVVRLDPARAEPEYLMGSGEPRYRKVAQIGRASVKQMPPWAKQTLWDAWDVVDFNGPIGANGSQLFFLVPPDGETKFYELRWYDKDFGRDPRRIPLKFVLDGESRTLFLSLFAKDERGRLDAIERPAGNDLSLYSVGQGICLMNSVVGIWFVPYSDIETYLKNHGAKEGPPAPPGEITAKLPPPEKDAQSQVIGDMIDPAVAEDSFR